MKRRIRMSMGVGTPSIIMILVVLILLAFTMLTLSTVQAEERLVKKQVTHAETLNKIECEAQRMLCKIDHVLYEAYLVYGAAIRQEQITSIVSYKECVQKSLGKLEDIKVYEEDGQVKVYYEIPESKQTLQVELVVELEPSLNSPFYHISQWSTKTEKVEYELDEPEFGEIIIP